MGVEIKGKVAAGGAGEKHRLVFHESPPLSALLAELGKHSDNFYAEMVFKSLGDANDGTPATSAAGAKVVLEWLKQIGAADDQTRIINGSGLFDANRVSADTLCRALRAAYRDPTISAEFVSQLAIGGVEGTLKWRFREHRDRHSIRAKTGTLAKSDALSGYVLGVNGADPVAFSIVLNGLGDHREDRRRIDRVVGQIVRVVGG
jgi:D-alanyl-D-alanine carboxypeptidase/D-alanyl-D-alanine-endopeptidase (penicillin-binding protein 4)